MSPKRKPAAENRYVWCVAALLAGALLLCAPLVLVKATADPDNAWLGPDPLTTPPAFAGQGWDAVVTVEASTRYGDSDLPQAVPLAPIAEPPVVALLSTEPAESESAVLSEGEAKELTPETVQIAELDDALIAESSGASVTYSPEPEPQSEPQETLPAPVQVAELDATDRRPDQQLEAEETPADMPVSEADGDDDSTSSVTPLPDATPDIAPPLPARRPTALRTAEIVVAQESSSTPRQTARPADRRATRDDDPPLQRWRPMALAPADADAPAKPKLSPPPAPKISHGAYQSQVWSALARAKPRAGQRGSATVSFNIGASGALRGVRVAKSSGNAKLDQMALATVRKAAPFPPPPGHKSGAASYTIRIDFH